jgi:hypothetical protein
MAQTSGFVEHASNEFRSLSVGLSAGSAQTIERSAVFSHNPVFLPSDLERLRENPTFAL